MAERTVAEWGLEGLEVGYGLDFDTADAWGLFASDAVSEAEPPRFSEPGLFVVRPDGTLYASIVQTMPFARPSTEGLLKSLAYIVENDYPARGEAPTAAP